MILLSNELFAQNVDPQKKFKQHINSVVQQVQETPEPDKKRAILNRSFDRLINVVNKIESLPDVPESDLSKLSDFKKDIQTKKDELNGKNGFSKIPPNQLNNFANFVQQDIEQADRVVTLSLTTVLLIVIILLLL